MKDGALFTPHIVNEAETRTFAYTGAIAGLCPTTEANLGDGLFPLEGFFNQKGRIGVGSDSNTSVRFNGGSCDF